jgi:hypothetical protein
MEKKLEKNVVHPLWGWRKDAESNRFNLPVQTLSIAPASGGVQSITGAEVYKESCPIYVPF